MELRHHANRPSIALAPHDMAPYPDPDRPGVVRVPIASRKHPGLEAIIDAADLPLVQGRRWNVSPGHAETEKDRASSGSVVWSGKLIPLARIIMGVVDDKERLVSHANGDKLDFRRANLLVRTRSEVALARRPPKRWEGFQPYPDPERPGVWRLPVRSNKLAREALIDEADLPIVQGRNWNWSSRSDGAMTGTVVLATVGRQEPLHRLILGLTDPKIRVMFANGDPLDCRRANLRAMTQAEVAQATRKAEARAGKDCSSAFKGVTWDSERGKWIAQVSKGQVYRSIGRFDDEEAAAQAYDDCARVWFGEHAYLNFPERATIEPARAWAQRIIDGTAVRERRRKFRRLRMEKRLRRAAREARRREQMKVLGERDPWAGDDAWARDPAVPKVGRQEARKLFGVSLQVWKRWQKVGWITCGQTAGGRTVYPLAEIERLLQVCGRLQPPYPDPERANVWRVPLFGRGMRRKEVLIDTSSLKLIEGGRCTLGATSTDRGHVTVWFPATKRHVPLRRLIMGAGDGQQNVQHRNTDILDCRRANLVVRTPAERTHTSRKAKAVKGKPPSSRFKGVSWHAGAKKWLAKIASGDVKKYLGVHEREEDAALAYDRAARMLFGPHAYFNFPRESPGPVRFVQLTGKAA